MNPLFMVSYFTLWALTVCLGACVVYMLRRMNRLKLPNFPPGIPEGELPGLEPRSEFPRLDMIDTDGKEFSLRNTVVVFSVTGCGVCKLLYPVLHKFKDKHPHLKLAILMFEENEGELPAVMQEYDITLPVIPHRMEEMTVYRTTVFPFAYTLDSNGRVVAKGHVNEEAHLRALAESILPQAPSLSPAG